MAATLLEQLFATDERAAMVVSDLTEALLWATEAGDEIGLGLDELRRITDELNTRRKAVRS
jgi:hypothetical protein